MIAIISSNGQERSVFAAICEGSGWPCAEFGSVLRARRLLGRISPKVIVTRHKLCDGYSDDVLKLAAPMASVGRTRVMVLIGAGSSTDLEVRQVRMGADVVLRDPIRPDVAVAYLARFRELAGGGSMERQPATGPTLSPHGRLEFAGAEINVLARELHHAGRMVTLTPKETAFVQVLATAADQVVTYDVLYSELMERRFGGDTSNMRVLLGKLCRSYKAVGIELRPLVEVIPKTGYRYRAQPQAEARAPGRQD